MGKSECHLSYLIPETVVNLSVLFIVTLTLVSFSALCAYLSSLQLRCSFISALHLGALLLTQACLEPVKQPVVAAGCHYTQLSHTFTTIIIFVWLPKGEA